MTSEANFERRLAKWRGELIRQANSVLARSGEFRFGSGLLQGGPPKIAIHSDFGPPGQSKDENQDFAAAWRARDQCSPLRWIVAVADGLSSSYRAEWGAEAVCWSSAATLLDNPGLLPHAQAARAMQVAAELLSKMAMLFHEQFDESRPAGDHLATWKFTLDEGLLLQTTLVLAWGVGGRAYLAAVGDGGAMHVHGGRLRRLMKCDTTTSLVRCLGPMDPFSEFDAWHELEFGEQDALALFTDGIDRGISSEADFAERALRKGRPDRGNVAKYRVKELIETAPEDHQDNLTLAIVDNR